MIFCFYKIKHQKFFYLIPRSKRNRNSQAALMYSPNILQELHKIDASLVGTTGKRKNSIFAPVSWALLDVCLFIYFFFVFHLISDS